MKDFKFTASDFLDESRFPMARIEAVVFKANAKLADIEAAIRADEREKMLRDAPVVYRQNESANWRDVTIEGDKYSARLVDIKKLGEE
jgi:hypothetical protein